MTFTARGGRRGFSGEALWRAALLGGAFCALKTLCALFTFPPEEGDAVWLPSGLTLAVLLHARKHRWPVYLAAVFLAQFFMAPVYGHSWLLAAFWALGNCLRTVLGAGLMRRWLDAPVTFSRPREVVALGLAGGLLSPLPSATLGVGVVAFEQGLSPAAFWWEWVNWYLADGLGALLVAPLLLTWRGAWPRRARPGAVAEWAVAMLPLALAAHVTFGVLSPQGIHLALPYVCLPLVLWVAWRWGPRGSALATLVLGSFAIWHTAAGRGPFGVLPATLRERVLAVQIFLAVASLSTLALAALVCERQRVERAQRLLAEAGAVLAESLNPADTLPRVARLLVPEMASGFVVWRVEGEDGRLVPAVRVGLTARGEARLRDEVRRTFGPSRRCVGPEGAVVLARLQHHGRMMGALALVRAGHTHLVRPRLAAFAEDLAHHCALALENARLLAQSQEAIRTRDEFMAIAAHELRTPLTALKLQLQGLPRLLEQQASAPEAVLPRFHAVTRQVSRLGRLVESLLDVGRLHTGRLHLEREPVDLGELVREVVERFSGELERAGCEVSLSLQPRVTGLWDRARLEQALTNLVGNALKFGAGRPIELRVEQREGRAHLLVRDHGIGVAPEALERIFGRFERAVSSREYGGLGLGLFLTRRIVEAHEGHLRVESRPGEGAAFQLELPATPRPSPSVHGRSASPWPGASADWHPA